LANLSRTLACTVVLIACSSASALALSPLVAFRDTNAMPTDATVKTGLSLTQVSCQGITLPSLPGARTAQLPPGITLPPGVTIPGVKQRKTKIPSFRKALTHARTTALKGKVGKVVKQLKKGTALGSEGDAHGLAVAAMTAGAPRLALAAMLVAEKEDPKDPMNLVNAAAPLATLGKPADAVALLEHADDMKGTLPAVMGVPARAVLKNNLGFAYSKLGRHTKALAALHKALSAAPRLAEANSNYGRELVCAGRSAEAVKVLKAGLARDKYDYVVPGGMANDFIPSLPIAAQVQELAAGTDGTLPQFRAPTTPGQSAAYHETLLAMENAAAAQSSADSSARTAAAARVAALPDVNLATKLRRSSIANLVNSSLDEPDIKAVHDNAIAGLAATNKVTTDFFVGELAPKHMECLQTEDYEGCFRPWCQDHLASAQGRFNAAFSNADTAMRDYWKLAGKRETGLAANLDQQDWHDMAMGDARAHADIAYGALLSELRTWVGSTRFWEPLCVAGREPPPEAAGGAATVDSPGACPPALKPFSGSFKNTVEIPPPKGGGEKPSKVDVSIKVSCSKVEVEVSKKVPGTGEIISLFAKGEHDFKNDTTTIVVGEKGSLDGLAAGQTRIYVTTGKNGIEDFGWRVGASVQGDPFGGLSSTTVTAKAWGGTENISFVGAIDYIPTAFGFGGP
jgi:tetratricopeptide (TPR) repeat protein